MEGGGGNGEKKGTDYRMWQEGRNEGKKEGKKESTCKTLDLIPLL